MRGTIAASLPVDNIYSQSCTGPAYKLCIGTDHIHGMRRMPGAR